MKGVVKYQRGDGFIELRDVEDTPPLPHQVKVEVKAAGICGSDLHILHDDIAIPIVPPVVVGHEFSGVVVEKGSSVGNGIRIGDRVTGEPSTSICGKCTYCKSERYNMCSNRKVLGYSSNGCFAKYCNVTYVHKLPDNVSFKAGAMTELLACCVHGVTEQTGISAGDLVVVTGPGPVGLLSALVAMAEGGIVLLCGTSSDQNRLRQARQLGIPHTVNIDEEDPLEQVKELTDGYGADVVLECSGAPPAVSLGLDMVRKRGKYTQIGLFGRPIEINFETIAFKEIEVRGALSQRPFAWRRSLKLMERGIVPGDRIVSHEFPLEAWKRAFDMVEAREGMKIVLIP
jgi:L-iditol 2-dehydrogenase